MVAALEEGKRSGGSGLRIWEEVTAWSASTDETNVEGRINLTPQISALAEYLNLSIFDPASLHDDIHPTPVGSTSGASVPAPTRPGPKGVKARTIKPAPTSPSAEEEEIAEERWARYRFGGLTGLAWLLQQLKDGATTSLPPEISTLLLNPTLWTALSPLTLPDTLTPSLGASQAPVRRSAYALLSVFIEAYPLEVGKEVMLQMLSAAVLGNCWLEREATVWETAGPAVVKFLSSKWSVSHDLSLVTLSVRISRCLGDRGEARVQRSIAWVS